MADLNYILQQGSYAPIQLVQSETDLSQSETVIDISPLRIARRISACVH